MDLPSQKLNKERYELQQKKCYGKQWGKFVKPKSFDLSKSGDMMLAYNGVKPLNASSTLNPGGLVNLTEDPETHSVSRIGIINV